MPEGSACRSTCENALCVRLANNQAISIDMIIDRFDRNNVYASKSNLVANTAVSGLSAVLATVNPYVSAKIY